MNPITNIQNELHFEHVTNSGEITCNACGSKTDNIAAIQMATLKIYEDEKNDFSIVVCSSACKKKMLDPKNREQVNKVIAGGISRQSFIASLDGKGPGQIKHEWAEWMNGQVKFTHVKNNNN